MTYHIGIDPGSHGALALYGEREIIIEDMPILVEKINGKNKSRIDAQRLADLLALWTDHYRVAGATIEQVSASSQMGVTSAFAFGEAFGMVRQAIASAQVPVQFVRPQEWKKHFKLIGQDKDVSRKRASELLPQHAHRWARKMDDGRAEAILLAIYGAK